MQQSWTLGPILVQALVCDSKTIIKTYAQSSKITGATPSRRRPCITKPNTRYASYVGCYLYQNHVVRSMPPLLSHTDQQKERMRRKKLYINAPAAKHCGYMNKTDGEPAWASNSGPTVCKTSSINRPASQKVKGPAMTSLRALPISKIKECYSLKSLPAPSGPSPCRFMIVSSAGSFDPFIGGLSGPARLGLSGIRLTYTCLFRRLAFFVHCDLHWSMATPTNVRAAIQHMSLSNRSLV